LKERKKERKKEKKVISLITRKNNKMGLFFVLMDMRERERKEEKVKERFYM
jgi:hypothetical protein